jgi:hypothetical protein
MNESKAFINGIKAHKENYKTSALSTIVQPIDFNFEEREVDTNLYCFFTRNNTKNNGIDRNQLQKPTLLNKLTTSAPKLNQKKIPMHTEITIIKLFEQDDILKHKNIKTLAQQKLTFNITDKIFAFFFKPMTSLFK